LALSAAKPNRQWYATLGFVALFLNGAPPNPSCPMFIPFIGARPSWVMGFCASVYHIKTKCCFITTFSLDVSVLSE
jgi:hypothetical protein